jgi:hypothetical protein
MFAQADFIVNKEITSFAVAMKNPIFDEDAERMVHTFRFLNDNDRFIGQKMVAKQSRFVELEGGSYEDRMNCITASFCVHKCWRVPLCRLL